MIIWEWIANFNNFSFDFQTIEDLWSLDAVVHLKDMLLLELGRGAILWSVWLVRNKLCFEGLLLSQKL